MAQIARRIIAQRVVADAICSGSGDSSSGGTDSQLPFLAQIRVIRERHANRRATITGGVGYPPRLCQDGRRKLTESSREFPKVSAWQSREGSLREVQVRSLLACRTTHRITRISRQRSDQIGRAHV